MGISCRITTFFVCVLLKGFIRHDQLPSLVNQSQPSPQVPTWTHQDPSYHSNHTRGRFTDKFAYSLLKYDLHAYLHRVCCICEQCKPRCKPCEPYKSFLQVFFFFFDWSRVWEVVDHFTPDYHSTIAIDRPPAILKAEMILGTSINGTHSQGTLSFPGKLILNLSTKVLNIEICPEKIQILLRLAELMLVHQV